MAWYDPTSWSLGDAAKGFAIGGPLGAIGNAASGGAISGALGSLWNSTIGNDPGADQERQRKQLLYQQAQQAGAFANQAQQGYNAYGAQGQQALAGLQALANGQNSVSALQLQQAMAQNLAQQRSLAASASQPAALMAARTAAIQSGRINAGLAGQQALAGIQERNQAMGQYGQLLGQLRGQDLNAALGSRQAAVTGYGAGNAGAPEPSWIQKYGPVINGALGAAAAASDRRLKTDVREADGEAIGAATKLPAFAYRYKDKRFGEGEQLGPMAQDLERAGLGHTVMDTPGGKVVNGAKLALANTAMISALARELDKRNTGKDA